MRIGRKIYWDLATGNPILDTGQREGSVIETTQEQDFTAYATLAERVPSTVGCIQLEFGELAQEFASCSGYRIDIATHTVIFDYTPPATPPPSVSLEERIIALENARLADMLGL